MGTSIELKAFALNTLASVAGSLAISSVIALWQRIHGHSIDWYGILGLFILTGAVFLLLLWLTRRNTPEVSHENSHNIWKAKERWRMMYETEYAKGGALDQVHKEETRKLEEELTAELAEVKAMDESLSLLTPLQIEVVRFRSDLATFAKGCGNLPEPPTRATVSAIRIGPFTPEQKEWIAEIFSWAGRYSEWAQKFGFGYREKFAPRLLSLVNRIGVQSNISVDAFGPFTSDVRPGDDLAILFSLLERTTWQLSPVPAMSVEYKVRKLLDVISADEFIAVSRDETFSKILDEIPVDGSL